MNSDTKPQFDTEELIRKVKAGESLTNEQEAFYMEHVLQIPADHIATIMAITNNKDPNILID